MRTKKLLGLVGGGAASVLMLAGCSGSVGVPAEVVTVTATATATESAPDSSALTDSEANADVDALAIELAWSKMSSAEQDNVCTAYNLSPEASWELFNDGAEGQITESAFYEFFSSVC